jgi:hypothetical protein
VCKVQAVTDKHVNSLSCESTSNIDNAESYMQQHSEASICFHLVAELLNCVWNIQLSSSGASVTVKYGKYCAQRLSLSCKCNLQTPAATMLEMHLIFTLSTAVIVLSIYIKMYVCMFQNNSGTPGAISTKLGTHMTIYI